MAKHVSDKGLNKLAEQMMAQLKTEGDVDAFTKAFRKQSAAVVSCSTLPKRIHMRDIISLCFFNHNYLYVTHIFQCVITEGFPF